MDVWTGEHLTSEHNLGVDFRLYATATDGMECRHINEKGKEMPNKNVMVEYFVSVSEILPRTSSLA